LERRRVWELKATDFIIPQNHLPERPGSRLAKQLSATINPYKQNVIAKSFAK